MSTTPTQKFTDQITRLDAQAKDIILAADAMRALLALHQGGVIVGMTPKTYATALDELIDQTREIPAEE